MYRVSNRPLSLMTGCVIGAAGAASAVSVLLMRLVLGSAIDAAPVVCEDSTGQAERSGLQVFDRATADYDALSVSTETSTAYEDEIRWGAVRDRYRLFLAYPEAVARWPELAASALNRAEKLDELVASLAEMQQLEIQAQAIAEADRAVRAQAEQRHGRRKLSLGRDVDCNLSGGFD